MPTCLHSILLVTVLLQPLSAQIPPMAVQQVPPIPSDSLELVPVNAQPVRDVNQRAEIINLLGNSHRLSNVRSHPYDLKTTFTTSDGKWQLEDTSPGSNLYRWTAQGPGYAAVHLQVNGVLYSDHTANALPLRLAQVRAAIFFNEPPLGPRASLRIAPANLDGTALTCALISRQAMTTAGTDGRRWDEEEYCVEAKANTLVTYSPVPGLFVHYDYSKALAFHDKLIWNKFTITQAGQTVIEAQTESVTDPPNNPAAFQPAGLNQIGVGPPMTPPWRSRMMASSPAPGPMAQIVVLHSMQSPDGKLTEVEVLASSDPSVNAAALARVSNGQGGLRGQTLEPGATPQSQEVFMIVEFTAWNQQR